MSNPFKSRAAADYTIGKFDPPEDIHYFLLTLYDTGRLDWIDVDPRVDMFVRENYGGSVGIILPLLYAGIIRGQWRADTQSAHLNLVRSKKELVRPIRSWLLQLAAS